MILFFYNVALLVALAASAPWWLWRMATTNKYREGLRESGWAAFREDCPLARLATGRSSGFMRSLWERFWPLPDW